MTAGLPSVTAWMIALPVSRPRGWPGAGAPVPSAVAVAAVPPRARLRALPRADQS